MQTIKTYLAYLFTARGKVNCNFYQKGCLQIDIRLIYFYKKIPPKLKYASKYVCCFKLFH